MTEPITATDLRTRIYRVLDEVVATGQPQRIVRGGHLLVLAPESPPSDVRLDLTRLPRREALACTPDELVEQGWADAWQGEAP